MKGVSQVDFAKIIGKSKQYVNKLVKDGKLPQNEDRSIDPELAVKWMKQSSDPARALANRNGADDEDFAEGSDTKSTYNRAAIIHKVAVGKIAELEYEKAIGQVVDKADVDREAFDCARITRDRIMALPQELAGPLVSMADEKEILIFLRNKFRDALMEAVNNVGIGA